MNKQTIQQAVTDIKAGMPITGFEKFYPELKGMKPIFNQYALDIKAGMPDKEAPKIYPELFSTQTQKSKPQIQTKGKSLVNKTADFFGNTFGKAGEFMFGGAVKAVVPVIGAGYESAKEMITGKQVDRTFTKMAEENLSPRKAVGTIASTALDLTVTGFADKAIAKGAMLAKTPLTKAAEAIYQSALKPRNIVKAGQVIKEAKDIAKIGLDERVWLT